MRWRGSAGFPVLGLSGSSAGLFTQDLYLRALASGNQGNAREPQDPKDRKAQGRSLPVRRHWPVAPWSGAAMIQEKADKDISSVGFFFLILSPEKMHGQE